jgi:hypothetical protein
MQVEARIGKPRNSMAAALRKCFAMQDPEVIDCVANLGTILHEDLNRLLSKLYGHYMQLLIVETRCITEGVRVPAERKGTVLIAHAGCASITLFFCVL